MLGLAARRAARAAWPLSAFLVGCGGDYQYAQHKVTCPSDEMNVDGACVLAKISLDSVGFLPTRTKEASMVGLESFRVRRGDGSIALSGDAKGPVSADTMEPDVRVADFTEVREPGEYYLEGAGTNGALMTSPHFRIAKDAFDAALAAAVIGLHGQRCGTAVHFDYAGVTFAHDACHQRDAFTTYLDGKSAIVASLGGWHDAGDYGKYVTNGAFSLGLLFKAWEHFPDALRQLALPIPEHGGALPDYLAETKWETDWLLTTQIADGSASHKVTAQNFESFIAPEDDHSTRYFAPVGTAATAEIAAVLAMAARIYQPYDDAYATTCLGAAERAYAYLGAHPSQLSPDLSQFKTGDYTLGDSGPRLWAAAEIFETTGDPAAQADVERRILAQATGRRASIIDSQWDWGNPNNLGVYEYLLSSRDGRDPALVRQIRDANQAAADKLAQASESHAYGRAGVTYTWGSNGTVARIVYNLQVAYRLSGNERYLDAAIRQIDHLFGRNYFARSQVTGVGDKPPLYPHHRPSAATGHAWPGLLVGGAKDGPTDWVDSQNAYDQNEVALNWNAALVYALAAFASGTNEGTSFLDPNLAVVTPDASAEASAPDAGAVEAGPIDEEELPAPDAADSSNAPDLDATADDASFDDALTGD
jgi:endoglucanase